MLTGKGIVEVDEVKASAPSLNKQQINNLVYFGRTIEQLFDNPQDIEFVIVNNGQIYIVQSRPIPSMEIEFSREELEEQQYLEQEKTRIKNRIADLRIRGKVSCSPVVFSDSNISELLPTPTPMAFGVFTYIFSNEGGIQIGRRNMGYQLHDETSEGMFELIAGHPYFNLEIDAKTFNVGFPLDIDGYIKAILSDPKLASYPELGLYQQSLTEEEAIAGFGSELGQKYFQKYQDFYNRISFYRERYLESFHSEIEPVLNKFVEKKQLIDYQSLTDQQLVDEYFEILEHMRTVSCVNFVIAARLGFFATERLKRHLENIFTPDRAATLLNDLLGGLPGSKITEERIASFQVASGQMSKDEYMKKFGHLAVNELEISLPRKNELVGQFSTQSSNPEDEFIEQRLKRQKIEEYLHSEIDKINELGLVNKISEDLSCAQAYLPLRETVKFHFTREYDLLRKALLTIQTRIELTNDDIFYLFPDEIPSIFNDMNNLISKINKRRKEKVLSKRLEVANKIPPVLFENDIAALGRPIVLEGQNEFVGMVVSKGKQTVAGVVRIIDSQNLDLNQILQEMAKIDNTIIVTEAANLGMDPIISRVV